MYITRVSYEAKLTFMNSFSNLRNSSSPVLLPEAVVTLHGFGLHGNDFLTIFIYFTYFFLLTLYL